MAVKTFAAIDVGSYELSMKIFEVSKARGIHEIDHIRHSIDMGTETYITGKLGYERAEELCRILGEFRDIMKSYQVETYKAYGTSAIREMKNKAILLDQVEQRTGIKIDVLSNSEQRFLDYKSIAFQGEEFLKIIENPTAIVDIGGGSTEVVAFADGKITDAVSLLFEPEEKILQKLDTLDLFNVSEIKRPKGGGMEIKFFDRLKAIDKIREMVNEQTDKSPTSFYEALEKSTQATKRHYTEEFDE